MDNVIDVNEKSMHEVLNFSYCGEDLMEYRNNCADRYLAIKNILENETPSSKRNEFIGKVKRIYESCQEDDVENIIAKLIVSKKYKEKKDIDMKVTYQSNLTNLDDLDITIYSKVLEFAIQNRFKSANIEKTIIESVNIEQDNKGNCIITAVFANIK